MVAADRTSRKDETHLCDLTILGKLFAFLIAPIICLIAAMAFTATLTGFVSALLTVTGLYTEEPTNSLLLSMLAVSWVLLSYVASPVSSVVSRWFDRRGLPLVDQAAKAERIHKNG
ncbi:hypothetical protein LF1_00410 [Rubripirellula obstinata]|uniref:Uncharacterized protein n=1 Tax=Rubripirellula obstinata TaxID=406547 RepID=A0A5B1CDX8_9BACT|nr:hypothetical protein [Rubripirellula obstinata]KAA1257554.1 hypothetical protein LF1_00410 [Rubripirellula obstinata]